MTLVHSGASASVPSPADILDRAADLLTPEGAWTQGVLYRDRGGDKVGVKDVKDRAVCFCIQGALYRVTDDLPLDTLDLWSLAEEAFADFVGTSTPEWNDDPDRTQAEVVAALRAAADKARSEAGQ